MKKLTNIQKKAKQAGYRITKNCLYREGKLLSRQADKVPNLEKLFDGEIKNKTVVFEWSFENNFPESPTLSASCGNLDMDIDLQSVPELRKYAKSLCKESGLIFSESPSNANHATDYKIALLEYNSQYR